MLLADHFKRAVVVAVPVMWVVQAAIDEIADMSAMVHRLMPAAGAVHMAGLVAEMRRIYRCAAARVGVGNLDLVLVNMVAMRMVQMPVMDVVDMIAVTHGCVAAPWAMFMRVVGVFGVVALGHNCPFPRGGTRSAPGNFAI